MPGPCDGRSIAPLKTFGDEAEFRVAADLRRRGHRVAIPFGEDSPYDLVVDRHGALERVQVKYSRSDGAVVIVRCRTQSLTAGRVRATSRYTAADVDWIAVFEPTTDEIFYVPSTVFDGRAEIRLRLSAPRNGQTSGIRRAEDFREI